MNTNPDTTEYLDDLVNLVCGAASKVVSAEARIKDQLHWVNRKANSIEDDLDCGQSMNDLGEFQSTANLLDAAIGARQASLSHFKAVANIYLKHEDDMTVDQRAYVRANVKSSVALQLHLYGEVVA